MRLRNSAQTLMILGRQQCFLKLFSYRYHVKQVFVSVASSSCPVYRPLESPPRFYIASILPNQSPAVSTLISLSPPPQSPSSFLPQAISPGPSNPSPCLQSPPKPVPPSHTETEAASPVTATKYKTPAVIVPKIGDTVSKQSVFETDTGLSRGISRSDDSSAVQNTTAHVSEVEKLDAATARGAVEPCSEKLPPAIPTFRELQKAILDRPPSTKKKAESMFVSDENTAINRTSQGVSVAAKVATEDNSSALNAAAVKRTSADLDIAAVHAKTTAVVRTAAAVETAAAARNAADEESEAKAKSAVVMKASAVSVTKAVARTAAVTTMDAAVPEKTPTVSTIALAEAKSRAPPQLPLKDDQEILFKILEALKRRFGRTDENLIVGRVIASTAEYDRHRAREIKEKVGCQ